MISFALLDFLHDRYKESKVSTLNTSLKSAALKHGKTKEVKNTTWSENNEDELQV